MEINYWVRFSRFSHTRPLAPFEMRTLNSDFPRLEKTLGISQSLAAALRRCSSLNCSTIPLRTRKISRSLSASQAVHPSCSMLMISHGGMDKKCVYFGSKATTDSNRNLNDFLPSLFPVYSLWALTDVNNALVFFSGVCSAPVHRISVVYKGISCKRRGRKEEFLEFLPPHRVFRKLGTIRFFSRPVPFLCPMHAKRTRSVIEKRTTIRLPYSSLVA